MTTGLLNMLLKIFVLNLAVDPKLFMELEEQIILIILLLIIQD